MDFNQFDSRAAAEKGAELHLEHPATGALLYADKAEKKPCIVTVRGSESPSVRDAVRAAQKARAKSKDAEQDANTLDGLNDSICEGAKRLIAGFKNINNGDKPATLQDIDWFLGLNMMIGREEEKSFAEQVVGFATSRGNYLGNVSAA